MKKSKYIMASIIIFWPLRLLLKNTLPNFVVYILPAILFYLSLRLYKNNNGIFFIPLLLIPFISPKLAPIPFIFLSLLFLFGKKESKTIPLITSFLALVINFNAFWGQTFFHLDYEKNQLILRNIHLYPSVLFARAFQNKAIVFLNKFYDNFFALIDPTNYFFGFHPRENNVLNQNLDKFPYLSLSFFLIGLYNLKKLKNVKFVLPFLLSSIFVLSVLTNFDRSDFILYIPLAMIILNGFKIFIIEAKKIFKKNVGIIYFVYIFFTTYEFIKIFVK